MKHIIIYFFRLLWATLVILLCLILMIINFIIEYKWENCLYSNKGEYYQNTFATWYENGTWKSLYHWALKIKFKN